MGTVAETIQKMGIIPVVVVQDAKDAVPLAKALCEGGLPCAEVTFRTEAAPEAIRQMAAAFPDMFVGAGTVLTTAQVDQAVEAGARFIVSPGFDAEIVEYCIRKQIPVFPAGQFGGVDAIKALAAPYPQLRFMPTGGINAGNLSTYLSCDKVVACGGSWMVNGDLVKAGKYEEITRLAEEAVNLVAEIRK